MLRPLGQNDAAKCFPIKTIPSRPLIQGTDSRRQQEEELVSFHEILTDGDQGLFTYGYEKVKPKDEEEQKRK